MEATQDTLGEAAGGQVGCARVSQIASHSYV